jgi:hypothetical protein
MKANELRIGNWVNNNPRDGVITVFSNDKCVIRHKAGIDRAFIEELEPIQLTEEWLLKFGFIKSKVSSQFDKEKLTIQIANELEYHKKGRVYFNSWAILEESIKYVHQLQNLYFALTGEELIIKSE